MNLVQTPQEDSDSSAGEGKVNEAQEDAQIPTSTRSTRKNLALRGKSNQYSSVLLKRLGIQLAEYEERCGASKTKCKSTSRDLLVIMPVKAGLRVNLQ
jgi:hypothetical protein